MYLIVQTAKDDGELLGIQMVPTLEAGTERVRTFNSPNFVTQLELWRYEGDGLFRKEGEEKP